MSAPSSREGAPSDGSGGVDPRFDPRFQRGYPRGSTEPAPATGAAADRPAASDPRTRSDRGSRLLAPPWTPSDTGSRPDERPAAMGGAPATAVVPHDAAPEDRLAADATDVRGASSGRRPGVLLVVLAAASALAAIVGAVGVVVLTTQPPLRLALAATSASAARQLALELVSGPVLTAGLLGIAVALALLVTGRRGAERAVEPEPTEVPDALRAAADPAPRATPQTPASAPDPDTVPFAPPASAATARFDESAFRPPGAREATSRRATPPDESVFRRGPEADGPADPPGSDGDESRFRP